MPDEQALVRATKRGDERALAELVRLVAPGVHAFMTGMFGPTAQAADATEETIVRLARAIGGFEGDDVRHWVFGLARRVAADHVLWRTPTSPGVFGGLAHQHREVLVMRETLDWALDTIAVALETSVDDARARLFAARDALFPATLVGAGEAP